MNAAPLIERILGANWRSTLFGFLTKVSASFTLWNALTPEQRADPAVIVPMVLTFLIGLLQDSNTKDKQVSGTPGTGQIVGTGGGEEPRRVEPKAP